MLFTPGQGILTIFLALLIMDYPGKYRLLTFLVDTEKGKKALSLARRLTGNTDLLKKYEKK